MRESLRRCNLRSPTVRNVTTVIIAFAVTLLASLASVILLLVQLPCHDGGHFSFANE